MYLFRIQLDEKLHCKGIRREDEPKIPHLTVCGGDDIVRDAGVQ